MSIESLPIKDIRTDGGTQPRVQLDQKTVEEYADAMRNGSQFPAVTVFLDDQDVYWLADGFHRLEAAKILKLDRIGAEVQRGSVRDAILYSLSANATHGLRRSRADIHQAVERLLLDPEWTKWSDSEIARWCLTSRQTVGRVRDELIKKGAILSNGHDSERIFVRGGKEHTMDTSEIGSNQPADLDPVETRPEDQSWFPFYCRVQKDHPNETVFMAVGEKASVWLVMGDRARRVAQQIGDQYESHQVNKTWTPMLKLWMGESSRIDKLEGRIGPVYHYLDNDPELRQFANQMHTADIREVEPAQQSALPPAPALQTLGSPVKIALDTPEKRALADAMFADEDDEEEAEVLCPTCQQPADPMITGEWVCTKCGQIFKDDGSTEAVSPDDLQGTADDIPVLRENFLSYAQELLPYLISLGEKTVEAEMQVDPSAETGETAALVSKLAAFTHLFLGDVETVVSRPERFASLRKQIQEAKSQRQLDDLLKAVHGLSISAPMGYRGANAVVQTLVDDLKARQAEIAAPSTATQEATSAAAR